jgi:two-component system sensor histidine kinase DesK
MRGVRAVANEEHTVSLRMETGGAATLLAAVGITADIDVDVPHLPPLVEETLAWAIREGVANVLLHSAAHSCSIVAARRNGALCLEISNDGAHRPAGEGRGLAGLAARALALSGTVTATQDDDGHFSLLVRIPEGRAR